VQAHDLAAARAALPDDFYMHDHRRTGVGPLGSADEFVASLAAAFEQSGDVTFETLWHVAIAEHGMLSVGRTFGTLRDGGEWESVLLRLTRHEGDRLIGMELFELEDLDRARARFQELRAAYAANG